MRIFNRIVVSLLLAGLFVLGIFGVVYSFNLFGYQLSQLPQLLKLQAIYSGTQELVSDVENGTLLSVVFFILLGIAILGLILLILELKPRTPRRVRMQKGTYVTRNAVKAQVLAATNQSSAALDSSAKVKARRGKGAKINLKSNVRRGEDVNSARSSIKDQVSDYLGQVGIPVAKMKVKASETDPRGKGEQRVN
ncbi:MAG: hypothetical protein WA990_02725 [Rubrobacteraceae bacterium]